MPTSEVVQNWSILQGNYFSLQVPVDWHPVRSSSGTGYCEDGWQLGVPGAIHASVSFSGADLIRFYPPEPLLISEATITIGAKPGYKWIRLIEVGEARIAYEYMTTGPADEGSFGLSVLMPAEDKIVEQQLDQVVATITFPNDAAGSQL